nr:MAG TPA: hypothetical protein [Caudoviricetes sp.]
MLRKLRIFIPSTHFRGLNARWFFAHFFAMRFVVCVYMGPISRKNT